MRHGGDDEYRPAEFFLQVLFHELGELAGLWHVRLVEDDDARAILQVT